MKPHEQRVVLEHQDLVTRIEALQTFVMGSTIRTLPAEEQQRLEVQLGLMKQLASVLAERIANFPNNECATSPFSSRVCELGTKCCTAVHARKALPEPIPPAILFCGVPLHLVRHFKESGLQCLTRLSIFPQTAYKRGDVTGGHGERAVLRIDTVRLRASSFELTFDISDGPWRAASIPADCILEEVLYL